MGFFFLLAVCIGRILPIREQCTYVATKKIKVPVPVAAKLNPSKKKQRQFYLKAQIVPRCKHFSSRLSKPINLGSSSKNYLFVKIKTQNTQIQCGQRLQLLDVKLLVLPVTSRL
jgi:hypothetical protein